MNPEQRALFTTQGEALLADLVVAFSRHPDIYGGVDDPQSTASQITWNFRTWLYDAVTKDDAQRWTGNIQNVLADVNSATGEDVSAWPSWHALVETVRMTGSDALDVATTFKDTVKIVTSNPGKAVVAGVLLYGGFLWLTRKE